MSYTMFLNNEQMPVTPGKLQLKIKGQNKTITLVNDGEVNFLRSPGLTEVTLDVLLPMYPGYTFANYPNGFKPPDHYTNLFKKLITEKKPAYLKVVRYSPNNNRLFDNEILVSVENYTITEDATNGPDVFVSLTLKQYREFSTKTMQVLNNKAARPTAVAEKQRETSGAPKASSYKVAKGDCLYNIAKKYYGDGAQYKKIYAANKDKVKNPNLIYTDQVLVLP